MEKSFAWDADLVNGEYDKVYYFEDFANYFASFINSGYFANPSEALQVIANGDMTVTLKAGKMFIDGYMYENTDNLTLALEPADGVLKRVDRISVTWEKNGKDIRATVLKGSPSYNPVPVVLRRTADHKDYIVADILVEAGAIRIEQKDITDQRLNPDVCGVAAGIIKQFDSETIYKQILSDLNYFKEIRESGFLEWQQGQLEEMESYFQKFQTTIETWFNNIKGQLDTDAAGNLQNQIDRIKGMYVLDHTLYLPNTSTSVSDGTLYLGTAEANEGGE